MDYLPEWWELAYPEDGALVGVRFDARLSVDRRHRLLQIGIASSPGCRGSRSKGTVSVCTGPPVRANRKAPKLCATKRLAPTARPAAKRWSVASARSRLVMIAASKRSGCRASRMLIFPDNAESRARYQAAHQVLLRRAPGHPDPSWPRATSSGTSSLPRTPVAPATKTLSEATTEHTYRQLRERRANYRHADTLKLPPAAPHHFTTRE
jgi:hypothetical protein